MEKRKGGIFRRMIQNSALGYRFRTFRSIYIPKLLILRLKNHQIESYTFAK